jgi:ATP-binding cassette subfamily F protein 3
VIAKADLFQEICTMIHLTNISKQYGSQILFSNASFQILPGTRNGLVGANGTGKTSIFRLIMGEEECDSGEIIKAKKTVVGYFSQDTGEMTGRSALEEVMSASIEISGLAVRIKEMEAAMCEPISDEEMADLLERYGEALSEFEHRSGYDLESRAQTVLTGLGIGPDEYNNPVETFSGGWKMRIELAKILTLNPDVLLLDEPTNHLDIESIIWLEDWIATNFKGALLMTCHDHDFMNRIVSRIVEIAGKTFNTYSGNYDFYLREKEIRMEQLQASYRRQQEMLAKEEDFIARFAARASHASQVQSRVKKIDKIERIELPVEQRRVKFQFAEPPRTGDDVFYLENLGKTWERFDGGLKPVFNGISGLIRRQEKIAVTGVNGAGKSTFLKVLSSETEPSTGAFTVGANVNIGYFSQHSMDILAPDKTVMDTIQEAMPNANLGVVRNLCAAFLFQGDDVDKRIFSLSGGEKSRVVLATIMARPVNVLILDEPTNHLDILTREILLETLQGFSGTAILVSHDRHFLRQLVNRVFEIDQGEMRVYEGDYEYYIHKSGRDHRMV